MEPEDAELCCNCMKLIRTDIRTSTTFFLKVAELQRSGQDCTLCAILWSLAEQRLIAVQSRFSQYDKVSTEKFDVGIEGTFVGQDKARITTFVVTAKIILPNKFNYPCSYTIGVLRSEKWGNGPRSVWDSFPTSPETKVMQARKWLELCRTTHMQCKVSEGYAVPRRLVDVFSQYEHGARLVLSEKVSQSSLEYICLSYCWGEGQNVKTTKANKEEWHKALPVGDLPLTFIHAFTMTRKLGFRYVWIDALCIIQDDEGDWKEEASKMCDIYARSAVTLIAAEADSAQGGFFRQNNATLENRQPHDRAFVKTLNEDSTPSLNIHIIPYQTHDTAISTRGWALQEDILALRTLQITDSELHWRCRTNRLRETGVQYTESEGRNAIPHLDVSTPRSSSHSVWQQWMEDYSRRVLTVPGDRLPAIAGVADFYSRLTGDTFSLGLWSSTIHKDLQWMRDGPGLQSLDSSTASRHLPSWSPFACNGALTYYFTSKPTSNEAEASILTINDCSVTWEGRPLVSEIASTLLKVTGALQNLYLSEAEEVPDCSPLYFNINHEVTVKDQPIPWRCQVQWDADVHHAPRSWPCLLLERRIPYRYLIDGEVFLVLEPVDSIGCETVFRRVGIGAIGSVRTRDGLQEQYSWTFDVHNRSTIILE